VKRVIGLALIVVACIIAFTSARGIPPLFSIFDSWGIIVAVTSLVLLALFLFRTEIRRGVNRVYRGIISPVLNEEKRVNGELIRKMEAAEKKMDTTEQALIQFSSAIADYARHLASHTSAIQGLSQASHELKKGAAEQNRVLSSIMENVAKPVCGQEPTTTVKEIPLKTQNPEPRTEKPAVSKIPPYHKALYKTDKVQPSNKIKKIFPATGKPETAIEKSSITAEKTVTKNEKLVVITRKPKLNIETLTPYSDQPEPEMKRIIPFADKLVISARKSIQRAEEIPDKLKHLRVHQSSDITLPPGCARRHEDQLWY
jgi:hypothetical protein